MSSRNCVLGLGSPHGDDQVGWQCVELLRGHLAAEDAQIVAIAEATRILDYVRGCERLAIVDACCSGAPVGTVTRLAWPDPRIMSPRWHSSHGISVADALRLAEQLGQLPAEVMVFGVEIGDCPPGEKISGPVRNAVARLVAQLADWHQGVTSSG